MQVSNHVYACQALFIYSFVAFFYIPKKLIEIITLSHKYLLIQRQLPCTMNMSTGVERRHTPETSTCGGLVKISICALMNSPFALPAELDLVSPIYFMTATPDTVFKKEVKLSLDHWARLAKDTKLFFVFALFDIENPK